MLLTGLTFVILAAAGTLLRAEASWVTNRPGHWPWGTFAANLLAAGGLGILVGAAGQNSATWSGPTVALAASSAAVACGLK